MYDVESIKAQLDIVSVIEKDEPLTERGGQWFGAHAKKHESKGKQCLVVTPTKGIYHCFHCETAGDIFAYVMDRDGCSFIEAVHWLCEAFRIPLPSLSPEERAKFEANAKERRRVRDVMKECFRFYHSQNQRDYFHQRGISDKIIDELLLGYAPPGGRALVDHVAGWLGVNKENAKEIKALMLATGLFFPNDDGRLRDRYVDRYVFPYWKGDETVFSIGRTIVPAEAERRKYVKHLTPSTEHPYVSQIAVEHLIWGLNTIRGAEEIIVTEGIVDAILAMQAGFAVLSPITTRFSEHDIERLAELTKHAKRVVVINDNEENEAGLEGAKKTATALFEAGRDVRLVSLPRPEGVEKVDLADRLNGFGTDGWQKQIDEVKGLIAHAPDWIEFRILEAVKLNGKERADVVAGIASMIASMEATYQEHYLDFAVEQNLITRSGMQKLMKAARIERAKAEKAERLAKVKETLSPEMFLKVQISEVRKNKYLMAFEVKRRVAGLVLDDMRAGGRFYQVKALNQFFWFDNLEKRLFRIGSDAFAIMVNQRYGLNQSEVEYEFLVHELIAEAGSSGKETMVHQFAFYDGERGLYVDNYRHGIYKLDGKTIELVDNGTDGVLFLEQPMNEPFTYQPGCADKFYEMMIAPINFAQGELSIEEQKGLFWVWTYSLFFESIQPTKPLQFFLGPKGSGKTTQQRMIGRWLFGKHFDLVPISADGEGDFVTAITNHAFIAFDNVDSVVKWLPDHLARLATGGKISKRELYTTNTEVTYYPKCFISLNAREPKFKRDDVTERLLVFRLERLEYFEAESKIMKRVAEARDALWSEHLDGLNQIVAALRADKEPFTTVFRMADFAEFGWRVMRRWGKGDEWLELLRKMSQSQSDFLLEDNPIFECLSEWMNELSNHGREMRMSELYEEFKLVSEAEGIGFHFKSAKSMGKIFRQMLPDIRRYCDVKDEQKKKIWFYTFQAKNETN